MSQRPLIMAYIMLIWFVISFVTNLIGPLMPIMIEEFHLSLAMAGFLPFSFFLAYGLISIPGGLLVERKGGRSTLLVAFVLNLAGSLAIALKPEYAAVIVGLFTIGLGMALLQVVVNPLLRTVGGESQFAFYSVMAQLIFGLASFLSPLVFSRLMAHAGAGGSAGVWVSFYWAFSVLFLVLIVVNHCLPLPTLALNDDEKSSGWHAYRVLLARRDVRLFFIGLVAYVGSEQTLANWMSQFLSTYHQLSPSVAGADAVARFWGLMSLGCLTGLGLLKLLDSRRVLALFSLLALGCVALALFGSAEMAVLAFPASGFCLSVMFSIIFSLALNSVPTHHGALSGILCSGILGGALLPLLVGFLGDHIGLRLAMTLLFLTLTFILAIAFWARPLVRNHTLTLAQLFGQQ